MTRSLPVLGLFAALLLAGCDKDAEPAHGSAEPPTAENAESPPAPAVASSPKKGAPMKKEYTATPNDKLGVLPESMGVPVGQSAPDFTATDLDGASTTLSSLRQKHGAILLAFYRGGWCPYCNFEIHKLSKAFPDFESKSVTPVAISVDKVDEASKTNATYEIPFPVLSDPDLRAHEAFRVVHEASDDEVARLEGFGIDIEKSSGKSHHKFAVPAFFLIDAKGVVRWAHADPEYKVRPTMEQLLAAVDGADLSRR